MGTHARAGARRASAARAAIAGVLVVAAATVVGGIGAVHGAWRAEAAPAAAPASAQAGRSPAAPSAPSSAPSSAPPSRAPASEGSERRSARSQQPPTTTAARAATPTRTAVSGGSGAAPIVRPGPERVSGTPCTPTARACVDRSARMAWLIDNGRVVRGRVRIQTGDRDTPTPLGTFTVQWKAQEYTSREYLTQMPYSVFFADGGIAFHEGRQDTSSGGCVKLIHEDAVAWFDFLQVGNEVQIH
jgi:lipoprotein-anchoring transpeptidase ErfK/SrfK